jgi:hypothetical protein
MTMTEDLEVAAPPAVEIDPPRPGRRLPPWLRPGAPAVTYIGIAVAVLGFLLILLAWAQVAGETQVYLQIPYLVSAGLTGVGLVMVGLTVVNVSAKQRDAIDRDRQMDQLVSILAELQSVMSEKKGTRRR